MFVYPVEQCELKLRHTFQHIWVIATVPHLVRHVFANGLNAPVILVSTVCDKEIELRVLLDFDTQFVQTLNGGIAGEEILGARSEGYDLQVSHPDDRTSDRKEIGDLLCNLIGRTNRLWGDMRHQMPHPQVIAAIKHATICVSTAINQIAVPLCCGYTHTGAIKPVYNQRLRRLRAEVAQIYDQSVAFPRSHLVKRKQNISLAFDHDGHLFN